jgi:GntR family transcriptional regulator/MocR family aminotransferase
VRGIAAGLHVTVELPAGHDERAVLDEAHRRRIDLTTTHDFWVSPGAVPPAPTLLLGYGQIPEHAIPTAIQELTEAIHAAAARRGT